MDQVSLCTFRTGPSVLQGFKDTGVLPWPLSSGAAGRAQVGLEQTWWVGFGLPPLLPGWRPFSGCVVGVTAYSRQRELTFYLQVKHAFLVLLKFQKYK